MIVRDYSPKTVHIRWETQRHLIFIGERIVPLTPTEYRLLYPLRHGVPVPYSELTYIVYNCTVDEKVRIMMDKHIDRIRNKLQGTGIYVYCVLGYGYALLPSSDEKESMA